GPRRAQDGRRPPRYARLPECEECRRALVDRVVAPEPGLELRRDDERRRPRARAEHDVADAGIREAREEEPRPLRQEVLDAHGTTPSARRTGRCLSAVSWYSAAGFESATMPAPV